MKYRSTFFTVPFALFALHDVARASDPVPVNVSNFARAESHLYFGRAVAQNGLGKIGHERTPVAIENQKVIRMNRDTLYSSGVFDLDAAPVTITLPDSPDKRFMSMLVLDEDHYVVEVVYAGSGTHTYSRDRVGTRYAMMIFRTLVNPDDAKDVAEAHAMQDKVKTEQASPGTWEMPNWDSASRDKAREALLALGSLGGIDEKRKFGSKASTEPVNHIVATATGWGGNPPEAAIYGGGFPKENDGKTIHRIIMKDVPVDGFWSLSVYNSKGYFEKNDLGAYSYNGITAKKNADGSATIQFGGCGQGVPNCLPIMSGWNYGLRLYRPRPEILDGSWKIPVPEPAASQP